MPANSYQDVVDRLQLTPHPEGGFFRRTYHPSLALDIRGKSRWCSTGIYYLLPRGEMSHFHRLKSDEMWHFYRGESVTLLEITLNGLLKKTKWAPTYWVRNFSGTWFLPAIGLPLTLTGNIAWWGVPWLPASIMKILSLEKKKSSFGSTLTIVWKSRGFV